MYLEHFGFECRRCRRIGWQRRIIQLYCIHTGTRVFFNPLQVSHRCLGRIQLLGKVTNRCRNYAQHCPQSSGVFFLHTRRLLSLVLVKMRCEVFDVRLRVNYRIVVRNTYFDHKTCFEVVHAILLPSVKRRQIRIVLQLLSSTKFRNYSKLLKMIRLCLWLLLQVILTDDSVKNKKKKQLGTLNERRSLLFVLYILRVFKN